MNDFGRLREKAIPRLPRYALALTHNVSQGHVRQAGGVSGVWLGRDECHGAGGKVGCGRCGCEQRSTAWRIVLRPQRRDQALRLKTHRCAALGLDSGTAAERLVSMPSSA